jgi:hypothetical protein
MKNTRIFISLLIVIGLIAVFLISTDTFALDQKRLPGSPSQLIPVQVPIIISCPPTATLKRTEETLYSGSDWQPMNSQFVKELPFNWIYIFNRKIVCCYALPEPSADPKSFGCRLDRNFPTGYECALQPTSKNSVICTPQPTK